MNDSGRLRFLAGAWMVLLLCSILTGCLQQPSPGSSPTQSDIVTATSRCSGGDILFMTEELYPFSYQNEDGVIEGRSVEVVRELQKRLNCSARIEIHPWNTSYETTLRTPGSALFSTVRSPEREAQFEWVGPIASLEYVLYSLSDRGIALRSLEAARTAGEIAVVEGDARHDFLIRNNFTNIRTYSSDEDCIGALLNRTVILFLGSSATTPETLRKKSIPDGTIEPVYTLLRSDLYLAFNRQTSPAVVQLYQDTLDAMKADGTYSRITGSSGIGKPSPEGQASGSDPEVDTALSALNALSHARMHGIFAAMKPLSLTADLKSGDWGRVRPLLISLEDEYPEARFWYANPDGSYYTTVDNLTSANLKDRVYFPGVLAGNISIGSIVVSKSTGKYTAIIAIPVFSDGRVEGILGTSVYCETLEQILEREIPLSKGYYFFILDSRGDPVLDSLPGEIFSLEESSAARATMYSREEGLIGYVHNGSPHLAKFRTSNLTGWKMAIGWRE